MYNGVVIAPKGLGLIHDEEALPNLVKISACKWFLVLQGCAHFQVSIPGRAE